MNGEVIHGFMISIPISPSHVTGKVRKIMLVYFFHMLIPDLV